MIVGPANARTALPASASKRLTAHKTDAGNLDLIFLWLALVVETLSDVVGQRQTATDDGLAQTAIAHRLRIHEAQVLELGNDIGVVGGRPLRITFRAWPVGDETIAFTADFPRSAISAWQTGST
jgi:hypothetical protein